MALGRRVGLLPPAIPAGVHELVASGDLPWLEWVEGFNVEELPDDVGRLLNWGPCHFVRRVESQGVWRVMASQAPQRWGWVSVGAPVKVRSSAQRMDQV